jgi:hypothetical protein
MVIHYTEEGNINENSNGVLSDFTVTTDAAEITKHRQTQQKESEAK